MYLALGDPGTQHMADRTSFRNSPGVCDYLLSLGVHQGGKSSEARRWYPSEVAGMGGGNRRRHVGGEE